MRLFRKILLTMDHIPYPGDLRNIIKTSLAFSDSNNEYDYFRKIYELIDPKNNTADLKNLQNHGFTVREIEVLTGVSKSQVSRELSA
jgi:Fic family protein